MSKGNDKNHVSFWFWMFALFVTALPCIGFVMVLVWAFIGENESRKNYFRAVIAWHLILFGIASVILICLGLFPVVIQRLEEWLKHVR